MERLTIKKDNEYKLVSGETKHGFPVLQKHADKLGQLEDIEEELGIDLLTLFKALKQNYVYRKGLDNNLFYNCEVCVRSVSMKGLMCFNEGFGWGECDFTLSWKDYGKTWALTKEEIEYDNRT